MTNAIGPIVRVIPHQPLRVQATALLSDLSAHPGEGTTGNVLPDCSWPILGGRRSPQRLDTLISHVLHARHWLSAVAIGG